MIIGVGTDLVDLARFEESLERTPTLRERLFTPGRGELRWSRWPPGSPPRRRWPRRSARRADCPGRTPRWSRQAGRPLRDAAAPSPRGSPELGSRRVHLSLSHDGGFALAFVVLESCLTPLDLRCMRRAHTVEQVRAAEAELMARLPEGALMQRAAAGLAVAIADLLGSVYAARVLLLVGAGDNGGDALWAGAMLAGGAPRRGGAAVVEGARRGPGGAAGRWWAHASRRRAARPDVVVDGIVGIGGRPGLSPEAEAALGRSLGAPVVAVDVPSGWRSTPAASTGAHVRADLTVTFGTHKVAHLVDPAAAGLRRRAPRRHRARPAGRRRSRRCSRWTSRRCCRCRRPFDHKYTRGVVGVRAGSQTYPGAAVLCTSGAVTGLAGMVRYVGSAADAVVPGTRRSSSGRAGCRPGWSAPGGDADAEQALAEALADGVPTVVDADALLHVARGRAGRRTDSARRRAGADARRRA